MKNDNKTCCDCDFFKSDEYEEYYWCNKGRRDYVRKNDKACEEASYDGSGISIVERRVFYL